MEEESGLIWYHALLLLHRQIDSTESVSKQNASEKHKAIHSHFRLNCFVFIWVSHTEKEILNCIPWYDGKVQKHTKYFDYQILSFIWLLFKYPLNRFRGFFSLSNIYIKLFYLFNIIFLVLLIPRFYIMWLLSYFLNVFIFLLRIFCWSLY